MSNTNVDQFLTDPSSIVCVKSPFKDPYHGHIDTGDLRIAKDRQQGKKTIFSQGPKYYELEQIDFDQARENIINDIKGFMSVWSQKHGIPVAVLLEWKNKLKERINIRITTLKT